MRAPKVVVAAVDAEVAVVVAVVAVVAAKAAGATLPAVEKISDPDPAVLGLAGQEPGVRASVPPGDGDRPGGDRRGFENRNRAGVPVLLSADGCGQAGVSALPD
jgi:hypothetical protein